jgi:hypothetical protein
MEFNFQKINPSGEPRGHRTFRESVSLVDVYVDASPLAVVAVVMVAMSTPPVAMLVITVTALVANFHDISRILQVGALAWQRAGALRNGEQQSGGNTKGGECFIHCVFLSCFVAVLQHTSQIWGSR